MNNKNLEIYNEYYKFFLHKFSKTDTDGDGLSDAIEDSLKTDSVLADTDGDGMNDGDEFNAGRNPLKPDNPSSPSLTNLLPNIPSLADIQKAIAALNATLGSGAGQLIQTLNDVVTYADSFITKILGQNWNLSTIWNDVSNKAAQFVDMLKQVYIYVQDLLDPSKAQGRGRGSGVITSRNGNIEVPQWLKDLKRQQEERVKDLGERIENFQDRLSGIETGLQKLQDMQATQAKEIENAEQRASISGVRNIIPRTIWKGIARDKFYALTREDKKGAGKRIVGIAESSDRGRTWRHLEKLPKEEERNMPQNLWSKYNRSEARLERKTWRAKQLERIREG